MKDALAIHRMLLEHETLHEIVRLPRAIAHADELPEVLGLPARRCLATRVYDFSTTSSVQRFVAAVVVEAGFEPLSESLRLVLGARSVRPAPADLVNNATEYAAYLVAPLLLPRSVRILIDQHLLEVPHQDGVAYTATGEPCTALGIRTFDLFTLSGAQSVDLGKVEEVGLTGVIPALPSSP
jgi:prolyl-tRNA editing enzyme YbaK/EbsC (Cys-tRNA(Pro) deacylase)